MNVAPDSSLTDLQQTIVDLQRQLAERAAERDEALAREAATAEALEVINSSSGNLAPVFDVILEKARSLCGSNRGGLLVRDGMHFRAVALHGIPEAFAELLRRGFTPGSPSSPIGRLTEGARFVHVAD